MVEACAAATPLAENPGAMLGLILGSAANQGRDKITLITSPGFHDLGAWLEQLIAESTGKLGKGIIPVNRETVGAPEVYGKDRIFAYIRLESGPDAAQDAKVAALEKAGHPVVRIALQQLIRVVCDLIHQLLVVLGDGEVDFAKPHHGVPMVRRFRLHQFDRAA